MVELKLVPTPPWRDTYRSDGLRVERTHGSWVIVPVAGAPLLRCPCCELPFPTLHAAQKTADREFPLEPPR